MRSQLPSFHSQFGEDRLLAAKFAGVEHGYFAEIGAFNGVDNSNTYHFEQLGWDGVLIEANPILAQQCRAVRTRSKVFSCAAVAPGSAANVTFDIAEGDLALSSLAITPDMLRRVPGRRIERVTVPARDLDSIFEESRFPRFDFITIDVEGHELDVLRGLSLNKWRPQVVILERNTHFPDPGIMPYMHRYGYVLDKTTGVNDWFVQTTVAEANSLRYRTRLFSRYYLPKILTAWRPLIRATLLKVGVLG